MKKKQQSYLLKFFKISLSFGLSFQILCGPQNSFAQPIAAEGHSNPSETVFSSESTMPPAVFSLGGRTSQDDSDAFVDLLAPVIGSDSQFLFLNPRASLSENSENEENIGIGIRRLILAENAIVGGNLFYDTRESENNNRFRQLGLGMEVLTEWVDARANYYLPDEDSSDRYVLESQDTQETVKTGEIFVSPTFFTHNEVQQIITRTTTTTTTSRHFDRFEQAMEGMDFEVGVKVPVVSKVAETRVFGGFYYYNSNFRDDIYGPKARLEVRATPGIIFDAEWFQDKELHESDYYVGARVRLPFDIGNIFHGKNPFEGAREYFRREPQLLKARMTDMIIRDMDIITEESDFIEDLTKFKVETTTVTSVEHDTLQDDITFVDSDNTSGEEDGTFEHPFNTIQEGVNNAFGDGLWVHVGFGTDYRENVVLRDNQVLWGAGFVRFGHEDGINGVRPTVDGQSKGPSITMANNSHVWGFHVINQGVEDLNPIFVRNIASENFNISRVGVYAENKTNLDVSNGNVFEANSTAVLFASENPNFAAVVDGNSFAFNGNGIKMFGQGSGSFITQISNNNIQNSGIGVELRTRDYALVAELITENTITNNSQGINLFSNNVQDTIIGIANNNVSANTGVNIEANLSSNNGDILIGIVGNDVSNSSSLLGILVDAQVTGGTGAIVAEILGNNANNNNFENIKLDLQSLNDDVNVLVSGNQASNSNASIGISLVGLAAGSGSVNAQIANNVANNNGGFANMLMDLDSIVGDVNANVTGNQASNGSTLGMILNGTTIIGAVNAQVANNVANGNNNENFSIDLDSIIGDVAVTVTNNQASDSNGSIGLLLNGATVIGNVSAAVTNNIANGNNGFANILTDLDSVIGNVNANVTGNQASNGSTLGVILNGTTSSGAVNAQVANNVANGNNNENFSIDLDSTNGDVTVTISNNQANDSNGSIGILLNATANVTGAVNATITNNIANGNNGFANMLMNLTSNFDDINLTLIGNQASNDAVLGILLNANANGLGNVNAFVNGNTADSNLANGFEMNFIAANDVTLTATFNNARFNGGDGIKVLLDAGAGAGNDVVLYGEGNVARNNTSDGFDLNAAGGSGSYNLDLGGGGASPGNNSFTNNGGFDFHDVSPLLAGVTFFAQSNFWVDPTPDSGDEFQSDNANTIDVSNALLVDPNP